MATEYGSGRIVTNGLVLSLDAADRNSYPGSGTTWFDTSGGLRNFTLENTPTWSNERGGAMVFDGINDFLTGPASNTFSIVQEHTVEVVFNIAELRSTVFFTWSNGGANGRQIFTHAPWGNDTIYYDVAVSSRVQYSPVPVGRIVHMAWRVRTSTTPRQQIFENNVSKADSGTNAVSSISMGTDPVYIAKIGDFSYWKGTIYYFRVYNRGLTDDELSQNYQLAKSRFGL
jgi:hypothetical protein